MIEIRPNMSETEMFLARIQHANKEVSNVSEGRIDAVRRLKTSIIAMALTNTINPLAGILMSAFVLRDAHRLGRKTQEIKELADEVLGLNDELLDYIVANVDVTYTENTNK